MNSKSKRLGSEKKYVEKFPGLKLYICQIIQSFIFLRKKYNNFKCLLSLIINIRMKSHNHMIHNYLYFDVFFQLLYFYIFK